MKNLLKNRIVIGLICIILSLIICFGLTPMFNNALKSKVSLVRVNTEIHKGDQITEKMITTVEVGGYNLPENVIRLKENACPTTWYTGQRMWLANTPTPTFTKGIIFWRASCQIPLC